MGEFAHRLHRATQKPCGLLLSKTRISPMRTDWSFHRTFTLAPLPTAWFLMRRRRKGSTRIFRMRRVVCMGKCPMTGLRGMQSNGHAPKGQKCLAQRQAKRRPGYNVAVQHAPCKGKSAETQPITFTFALTGRGLIWRGGLPRVSLRLPWAKEAIGLSARLGLELGEGFQSALFDRDEQSVTRS